MMRSASRTLAISRVRDHNGLGRARCGVLEALLDPCRTVNQNEREALFLQIGDNLLHLLWADRAFVPCLGGGQKREVLVALVFDERLTQFRPPFHNVHDVVDDAVLQAKRQVEVAQPDVSIQQGHFFSQSRQRGPDVGRRGGLADASLARCKLQSPVPC